MSGRRIDLKIRNRGHRALKFGDQISLIFTKVVDAGTLGLDDEEEEVQAVTDRTYWETERGTKETVALADEMLNLIKTFAPERELRYNRYYVGLGKDEQPNNFAVFFPKRSSFQTNIYLKSSPEIDRQLEAAGIDVMDYDKRGGGYRLRVTKSDISTRNSWSRC